MSPTDARSADFSPDPAEGRYYAFHFPQVVAAVDYCSRIVPHLARRLRSGDAGQPDSPAVWFVMRDEGCDLLMTRGAVLAALEGGLTVPRVAADSRATLPAAAVLVLGDDDPAAPQRARGPRPREAARTLDQVIRLTA